MNAKAIVEQDIKAGISKYLKDKLIIQPNFSDKRDITMFCIESKHTLTGINKTSDYRKKFSEIEDAGNYICALIDGSLIQVKYVFDADGRNNNVSAACLVYLPCPRECSIIEKGIEGKDIEFSNMKNYIRIDMNEDETTYSKISHPKAHMHIGLYNDFRIGIHRVPLFTEFIEIILYLNYPDIWKGKFAGDKEMHQFVDQFIKTRNIITQNECLENVEKEFISLVV